MMTEAIQLLTGANWAQKGDLTDKNGIPISVVISSANRHDIKAVTDVIDNAVAKGPVAFLSTTKVRRKRRQHQNLCLDRAYSSKSAKQVITKRGYVPHKPYKRNRPKEKIKVL